MPRTSQAAIATLEVVSDVEIIRRVRPPDELTDEQRAEFMRVVGEMPAEWFSSGNRALLTQYARHVVTARRLAEQIESAISEGQADEVERLIKAQATESRMIYTLMTALRLTPQAVEPKNVSLKRLQQTESPWRGFGKKRR